MSEALKLKDRELTDAYNLVNRELSSLNQSREDPKEIRKIRRQLIKKKSRLEIDIKAVKAELRGFYSNRDAWRETLRADIMTAREILKDSLIMMKDFREKGFDSIRAAEYANSVTVFLLTTLDDLTI